MARVLIAAFVLTLPFAPAVRADDVEDKLTEAKAAYEKAMGEYKEDIGKWFDKETEAARKLTTGATEKVRKLDEERKTFEDKRVLPARVPVAIRSKSLKAADALVKVYMTAADGYTKAKRDGDAHKLVTEMEDMVGKGMESVDMMKRMLIGTWGLKSAAYTADLTFKADGTVLQLNTKDGSSGKPGADHKGVVVFDLPNQCMVITWENKAITKLMLPLNKKKTVAQSGNHPEWKIEVSKK